MPIDLTYTYTKTEFQNSFESDFWGDVEAGYELPYVPESQLQFTIGLKGDKWSTDLLVRYMDAMRTEAGTGTIPSDDKVASRTVVDLAAHYNIADNHEVTFMVDNLFDEAYMASRVHGSILSLIHI